MEGNLKAEDNEFKDKYDKIQNVVEDLNGKLVGMFRRRQEQLLEEYKNQMFKAQAELDQLRENTNQQQLKRRIAEKKEQLEAEREQFREASIFFSGKCETFKHKLQKVMAETKDLQNQIKFLNDQIHNAQRKNIKLKDQLETIRKQPSQRLDEISVSLATSKKESRKESSLDHAQSMVKKRANRSPTNSRLGQTDVKKMEERNAKLKNLIEDPVFKQTELESLFMDSVNAVKEKKKNRMSSLRAKLPSISKEPNQQNLEGNLSDFDKRLIMQDFLSREEVKKFLYGIIFKDVTKTEEGGVLTRGQTFQ